MKVRDRGRARRRRSCGARWTRRARAPGRCWRRARSWARGGGSRRSGRSAFGAQRRTRHGILGVPPAAPSGGEESAQSCGRGGRRDAGLRLRPRGARDSEKRRRDPVTGRARSAVETASSDPGLAGGPDGTPSPAENSSFPLNRSTSEKVLGFEFGGTSEVAFPS